MKKIIIYIVFILVLVGCFVAYALLSRGQKYEEIIYHIEYPSDTLFTEAELAQYVKTNCVSVIGKSLDSVPLTALEKIVDDYPYLENADVINNRGTLIIKARQEKIVAKVYNVNNAAFLLAQSGKLVPLSNKTAGRIVVANGDIRYKYTAQSRVQDNVDSLPTKTNVTKYHNTLYMVWKIACFIENDPFWKAQIGQIFVNEKQEIELVPTVGEHVVLFGRLRLHEDVDNMIAEKFNNLIYIYTKGFKITGWDKYKTVDLRFGTEIPCERRTN